MGEGLAREATALDHDTNALIEQQLFRLLRRTNAIHVSTSTGEVDLERSSYGILSLLADEGPQRLGAIATTFRLDPSTVTRQVQTVVNLGMARKDPDPTDRRANTLALTAGGLGLLARLKAIDDQVCQGFVDRLGARDHATLIELLKRLARGGAAPA